MFSSRVAADLTPNRPTAVARSLRASGVALIDLTLSNPTHAALPYPADLLAPLREATDTDYTPDPRGLPAGRAAVALDYARRGVAIAPDDVVLTASTSEAYAWLLKLLCAPGDAVLAPAPSYPLIEHLGRLEGVDVRTFPLVYHGRWDVDVDGLRAAASSRARAVVLVQPNNPTGSFVSAEDVEAIGELCRRRSMPLVVDEVFVDFPLGDGTPAALPSDVLTFRLGGLSKSIGMPQLKLAWIAMQGPAAQVAAARERLALIADMYLSVSSPVQRAAGDLLDRGAAVRALIHERVLDGHRRAASVMARHPACQLLHAQAGWSAVIQVPATRSEEALVIELLERDHVRVHPGYFFDFPREAFIVVSLLVPTDELGAGLERALARAMT